MLLIPVERRKSRNSDKWLSHNPAVDTDGTGTVLVGLARADRTLPRLERGYGDHGGAGLATGIVVLRHGGPGSGPAEETSTQSTGETDDDYKQYEQADSGAHTYPGEDSRLLNDLPFYRLLLAE